MCASMHVYIFAYGCAYWQRSQFYACVLEHVCEREMMEAMEATLPGGISHPIVGG